MEQLTRKQKSFLRASLKKFFEGVHVDFERCTHCGHCVEVCSNGFFRLNEGEGVIVIHLSMNLCPGNWNCGHCVEVCEQDAITVAKVEEHIPAQRLSA